MADSKSRAQEDYERFSAVADDLDLDDEDGDDESKKHRSNFINNAMKRKGHKPVMTWADADDDGGDKKKQQNGDPFGPRRSARGNGNSGGNGQYR